MLTFDQKFLADDATGGVGSDITSVALAGGIYMMRDETWIDERRARFTADLAGSKRSGPEGVLGVAADGCNLLG